MADWPSQDPQATASAAVDDDWGDDFGGFEAAEPIQPAMAQPVQQGITATPSIWAQLSTGAVPQVSPGGTANQSPGGVNTDPAQGVPFHDGGSQTPESQRSRTISGTSQASSEAEPTATANQIHFPTDFSQLDAPAEVLPANKAVPQSAASQSGTEPAIPQPNQVSVDSGDNQSKESIPTSSTNESTATPDQSQQGDAVIPQHVPTAILEENKELKDQVQKLHDNLSTAEREKLAIQQDLQDLLQKQQAVEQQLSDQTLLSEQQKEKYQQLQEKHLEELADIRKAGHDALAVIVEEYKELCKTAVLQQQELCEKQLQAALTKETERCEELLQKQHDRLLQQLEEDRGQTEERVQVAIKQQQQKDQEEFEKVLAQEREKSQQAIQEAVKAEQEAGRDALQAALQEERGKSRDLLEEQRAELQGLLQEERDRGRQAVEEAVREERKRAKDVTAAAVEEERQRGREAVSRAVEQAQQEMKLYITEQRKADQAVRQRSLAGVELFLSGALQQIRTLMDNSPPRENTTEETDST
ncbi:coiled-coil domain-containing protein 91-like isoform X1 [Branchiostoma floridae]|uniref:Coiled-coil domain-containing protein 91-like isoform X1 n=2 Tax=Branchiostoma floridae TaxID=7739 RepID=A0A9J7L1I1_BRAFL|nr:coiled-coil domain-containing protein 91-like isoform X1 [Branchiostoma floridae]